MLAAELGASVIEVPDTAHAVADIAREWRSHPARSRDRADGFHRQDHHEEPCARRAGKHAVHGGDGRQPEQLSWAFPKTAARRRAGHAGGGGGDGHARRGPAGRPMRLRAPRLGPRGERGREPYRASGQPREHRARQGRASMRAAGGHGPGVRERPTTTTPISCASMRASTRAAWRPCCSTGLRRRQPSAAPRPKPPKRRVPPCGPSRWSSTSRSPALSAARRRLRGCP